MAIFYYWIHEHHRPPPLPNPHPRLSNRVTFLVKPDCILIKLVRGRGQSQTMCPLISMIEEFFPGASVEGPLHSVALLCGKCVISYVEPEIAAKLQ